MEEASKVRLYTVQIIHTLGSETIEIHADSRDHATILARDCAMAEGLILLRCYVAS
jgi:hypothetical protein